MAKELAVALQGRQRGTAKRLREAEARAVVVFVLEELERPQERQLGLL